MGLTKQVLSLHERGLVARMDRCPRPMETVPWGDEIDSFDRVETSRGVHEPVPPGQGADLVAWRMEVPRSGDRSCRPHDPVHWTGGPDPVDRGIWFTRTEEPISWAMGS